MIVLVANYLSQHGEAFVAVVRVEAESIDTEIHRYSHDAGTFECTHTGGAVGGSAVSDGFSMSTSATFFRYDELDHEQPFELSVVVSYSGAWQAEFVESEIAGS